MKTKTFSVSIVYDDTAAPIQQTRTNNWLISRCNLAIVCIMTIQDEAQWVTNIALVSTNPVESR